MISREKADAIRELADENGCIEPANVVNAARNKHHPLHDDFNWDVQQAAQAHWLDTARRLIRLVKVEVTLVDRVITAVAYVRDPDRPAKSTRYVDLTIAAMNRDVAQAILIDEMTRITAAVRRAKQVCAVLGLTAQLDALLLNVNAIVAAAEKIPTGRRARKQPRASARKRRASAEARV